MTTLLVLLLEGSRGACKELSKFMVHVSLTYLLDHVNFGLRNFSGFIEGSKPECVAVVELFALTIVIKLNLSSSHLSE